MIQCGLLLIDRAEGNRNKDFKTKHRVLNSKISHTLTAQRYQASFVNDLQCGRQSAKAKGKP